MPILALACAVLIQGCAKPTAQNASRQNELTRILKPLQRPGVLDGAEWQEDPGWYEPTNRQALKNFVAKYPETEEGYQAEVWLCFAAAQTEQSSVPSEEERRRLEMADRLNIISHKTARSGTQKLANLQRAFVLFEETNEDHTEFKKQVDEILSRIKDYEAERDEQFLRFLELTKMRHSDIEPTLRDLAVVEERYEHHWDKALELAKDLRKKFPNWDSQSVNGEIEMLELYKSGWTPENSSRNLK